MYTDNTVLHIIVCMKNVNHCVIIRLRPSVAFLEVDLQTLQTFSTESYLLSYHSH